MKWLPWTEDDHDLMTLVTDDCHHKRGADVRGGDQLAMWGRRVYNYLDGMGDGPFTGYALGKAVSWTPFPPEVETREKVAWCAMAMELFR